MDGKKGAGNSLVGTSFQKLTSKCRKKKKKKPKELLL
jgi:hypothetical protein